MGVSVYANHSTLSFDMGGGGFFNIRKNIAYALNEDLGEVYESLLRCHYKADFEEHDRKANKIIADNNLEEYADVLDFLYASDIEGKISHKTCKRIYDLIKDIDFGDKCFRYAAQAHNDYEEFKQFLLECYSHHRKMRWS